MTDDAMIEPSPQRGRTISTVADELLLLILAGIPTGVLVAGIGSRVAMLLLRLTSDSSVIGIQSDDDFTIGKFTLSGTYNLMLLGAFVGLIGAAAYQWVRPWLLGPRWLRYLTVALAAGAVVGSMLVHADGIDFRLLTPTWLAIGLFVVLPGCFGAAIAAVVDHLDRDGSWTRRGRARWIAAGVCLLAFPPTIVVAIVSIVVLLIWVPVRTSFQHEYPGPPTPGVAWTVRGLWLAIALLGLWTLINDIRDISAVT